MFLHFSHFCRLAGTVGCKAWTPMPGITVPHWRVILPYRFMELRIEFIKKDEVQIVFLIILSWIGSESLKCAVAKM